MRLSEFLSLEGEFDISANDAQELNRILSEVSASAIPKEKLDQVLDYLIAALNAESVEPTCKTGIESLVSDLQGIR